MLNKTFTIQALNAKSAKSRMVGMTTRLKNWLSQYENLDGDDRIFPIADCKAAWTKAVKLAEIEDYHFHDNRHTCISRMVRAGLNHTEIMRISGHATLSCLFRYINTDFEAISRVVTVLDNYLTIGNLQSDASQPSDFVN